MSDHGTITDLSVSVSNSPRAPADRIGSGIKDQDQGSGKGEDTTTAVDRARQQLVSELTKCGVSAAVGVVKRLADGDLDRAARVVAYWEAQANVRPGLLVELLKEGFEPPQRRLAEDPAERSRRRYFELHDWALAHGFDGRQAPFVAAALLCWAHYRPPRGTPTASALRTHLEATMPELFTDKEVACPASS